MSDPRDRQRLLDAKAGGNQLVEWTSTGEFLRDLVGRFLARTHSTLGLTNGGVVCAPWSPDVPAGGRG